MKFLYLSALVVWCMLMSERPAHAYLDPGSGSMFLQLVLGGVAGVGLIAKLYWRKLLSFVGLRPRDNQPEPRQHP
jgi:hypothetical protein